MSRSLFAISLVILFGCPASYYGGGGDDDDSAPSSGSAVMSITYVNNTGYEIIHVTTAFGGELGEWGVAGGPLNLQDGTSVGATETLDEIDYGDDLWIISWAVDVDEWCLHTDFHVTTGPEVDIEIEFTDSDYLGYIDELQPPTCGQYGQ